MAGQGAEMHGRRLLGLERKEGAEAEVVGIEAGVRAREEVRGHREQERERVVLEDREQGLRRIISRAEVRHFEAVWSHRVRNMGHLALGALGTLGNTYVNAVQSMVTFSNDITRLIRGLQRKKLWHAQRFYVQIWDRGRGLRTAEFDLEVEEILARERIYYGSGVQMRTLHSSFRTRLLALRAWRKRKRPQRDDSNKRVRLNADVIVLTGGGSTGGEDYVVLT